MRASISPPVCQMYDICKKVFRLIDFLAIKWYHNRDMWIVREANPFGRLSLRKLLLFVAAVCAASFAYIFIAAPTTHAADIQWNGETLTYNQQQYIKQEDAGANDSRGIAQGTHIYSFTEKKSVDPDAPQKIHFIFIDAKTDPTKATTASYVTYDFTPPDTFKNPSDKKTISMSPRTDADTKTTSCVVEGIGWMVCPITNFFAGAMDWLFDMLSGFLAVRPVQTTQTNALYRGWSYMRNFANVAFVIAFMVIIYSQVSTYGISNYGIKKLLPRLIIAAILVNISYWICAIAIDISNILGYSIQDIFISMRKGLVGGEGNSWNVTSWESVTGFVLSGGTALTALGIGTYSALAGAGGAIYLLLPILLGVLMAVLVALLVLAARQAIITILVIISPLAFVAFILPNTEKYFKKWHELGMTLLVMFPAFSVVFGGSQLAGTAIIQNADSINLIILGMAVQVAPLAITPLLMRVSGSLLTKIGGLVNNPKRGMVDRTRNWANDRAADHKARNLGRSDLKRRNFMARSAQAIDNRNRKREGWRKANESMADAKWENTQEAHKIHAASAKAALQKSVGESAAEAHFERLKHTDAAIQDLDLKARANHLRVDLAKAKVDANWAEMQAGDARHLVAPDNLSVSALASFAHTRNDLAKSLQADTMENAVEARRQSAAKFEQTRQLAETISVDQAMQARAGGIDPNGAQRALADALKNKATARREAVDNAGIVIEFGNLTDTEIVDLAAGSDNARKGIKSTFDVREAAIKKIASGGNITELNRMLETIDLTPNPQNENLRIALTETLRKNGKRPKYIGSTLLAEFEQGLTSGFGTNGMDAAIADTAKKGKFSAEELVEQDDKALIRIAQAIRSNPGDYDAATRAKLDQQIRKIYTSPILSNRIGEREEPLQDILRLL